MPPRALALGIVQLNGFIIAGFVLRQEEGSFGVWTWADNLQNFPINVVGVSLALSAFPVFSQAFAENDMAKFKTIFSTNFRRILFLIIPLSMSFLLLRAQIVRLILGSVQGGHFDWHDTILTAQVLGFCSISMFAQATIPLLARSFFAHQDTKTPVYISVVAMVINILLAVILSQSLGLYGLALGFSMTNLISMLLLLIVLRVKFGDMDDERIIRSTWKVILATIVMGFVIHGMKYFIAPLVDMHTFLGVFIQSVASFTAGALIYIVIALYAQFDEVDIIRGYWDKVMQTVRKAVKIS
jgi:putative peptidoglycan lipid II flippase